MTIPFFCIFLAFLLNMFSKAPVALAMSGFDSWPSELSLCNGCATLARARGRTEAGGSAKGGGEI